MITCQICGKQFNKQLTWRHLAQHQTTTSEYKTNFGPVISEEFKREMSAARSGSNNSNYGKGHKWSDEQKEKLKGRVPHNKGQKVTDPFVLENIKKGIEKREQRFRAGEFSRGSSKTQEQRQILSEKSKQYATENPDIMRERAERAIKTKQQRGYDFGSTMRGKKHSTEAREKISQASKRSAQAKSERSLDILLAKIDSSGFDLLARTGVYLKLRCRQCSHEFQITRPYFTPSKYRTDTCAVCHPRQYKQSAGELEVLEYIRSLGFPAISGYRVHAKSKELDIFIPEKNVAIEYNGLYWHSEELRVHNGKSPTSDYEKMLEFKKQGIRIINIFEDEWLNKKDIVKSRLRSILGVETNRVYARKCEVREISSNVAAAFCERTHIMGRARSNVRLGLFHGDQMVSVMTFTKSNISRRVSGWEINRFSSELNTLVVGGASRLFSHFTRLIRPERVISYADNRWSQGSLYQSLGFQCESEGRPGYWYVLPNQTQRIHRFNLRKNASDRQELTEYENRRAQGYSRVWDCGSSKWIWTTPDTP
jgi:hypothetical protein